MQRDCILCYDINIAPVFDALLYHSADGFPNSDIAQQAQAVSVLPFLHLLHRVLLCPAHCGTFVTVRQDCPNKGPSHVARSPKHLQKG
jgi:hypothetical protein